MKTKKSGISMKHYQWILSVVSRFTLDTTDILVENLYVNDDCDDSFTENCGSKNMSWHAALKVLDDFVSDGNRPHFWDSGIITYAKGSIIVVFEEQDFVFGRHFTALRLSNFKRKFDIRCAEDQKRICAKAASRASSSKDIDG